MKKNKMTSKVILSIALIFTLFLTTAIECNAKPNTADLSQQTVYKPATPPVKVLGTPGSLGTIPWWIHDFINKIKIKFFPCKNFEYGSSDCNPASDGVNNQPSMVKMPGFFMFEGLVTNGEYAACEEAGVCTPPQTSDQGPCSQYRNSKFADLPVVCINWYQADMFCKWAESSLPTAAQWEEGTCGKPGSVREWMNDWYSPTPQKIGLFNPTGPVEGKLKLVRGGGKADTGFAPDTVHEDVGFRCTPTTPEYAPFCPARFTGFCNDPNTPLRTDPCTPIVQKGGGATTISNFGCPADGRVSITFNSNGGGNTGFNATINGQPFSCAPTAQADVFVCTGPEQRMGSTVNITVCGGGQTPPANSPQTATGGSIKTNLFSQDLLNVHKTIVHNCPDGYIWQESSDSGGSIFGQCVRDPKMDCPSGWYLSALMTCQPRDNTSCPPGTKMDIKLGGCVTEQNCPEGYVLTEKKTCEPEQNDRKLCPAGYYFNKEIQCCQPIRGNNYQCDENHYYDPNYKRCMPIDGNGCGFNFVYDCFGRCIGQPYQDPKSPGEGQCPGNLIFTAANICNTPPSGYDDNKPDPLRLRRPGDILTADGLITSGDNKNCGQGATFVAAFNTCIQRDENNCPFGYHLDVNLKRCVPDNGPGSGCPQGYAYQKRLECCAPIPGYDGSRCPQDQQTAASANLDTSDPRLVNNLTVYDPLQGACNPGSSQSDQTGQCPPGYPSTNAQPCSFNANADGNLPQCGINEYFDKYLGYCVPLLPNCCPLGESFSALLKHCAPDVGEPPREGKVCANGYELVNGQCLLIGREAGGQCVTISVNVPTCIGPCKVGYTYNPVSGRCEKKQDNCANVICSRYTAKNCPSNCCKVSQSGACVNK